MQVFRLSPLFSERFGVNLLRRGMAYYNIDWKPAPYPCTNAQKEAAAKRYGLLPSDYKSFKNDGLAPGDYPNLEPFNEGHRDPWEHYDYYPQKRNYNEPLPFYYEFFSEAGHDPLQDEVAYDAQSKLWLFFKFLAPFLFLGGMVYVGEMYKMFPPMKAKQFPFHEDSNRHYTFDEPK